MLKIVFLLTAITPCFMGNHAELSFEITPKTPVQDATLWNKLKTFAVFTQSISFMIFK